jgi:hypothetical protein
MISPDCDAQGVYETELLRRLSRLAELEAENEKLEKENLRLVNRDSVWREKKQILENDLAKAWAENKKLKEKLERIKENVPHLKKGNCLTIFEGIVIGILDEG